MRKSFMWLGTLAVSLGLILSGCGVKTSESVLKDLQQKSQSMKSYESKSTMVVQSKSLTQTYHVDTAYESPDHYRIAIANDKDQVQQIVIRNTDGIFIVSPPLKKMFRFNGDWAKNQGHVYLYDAVIDRIANAKDRTFQNENGVCTYTIPMVPENPLVSKQRIQFDSGSLNPKVIEFLSHDDKAVVTVKYTSFKNNVDINDDVFDPQKALAQGKTDAVVMAMAGKKDFGVIEPSFVPDGYSLKDVQESGNAVIISYAGQDNAITLAEWRPIPQTNALPEGSQVVDLWGHVGVLSGMGDAKTLYWTRDGVEFQMTSSLPVDNMVDMAVSTMGSVGK